MKLTQLPRKLTALLLAAVMVVSMLPTVAFGDSGQTYGVGADTGLSSVSQTYAVGGDTGGIAERSDAFMNGMTVYITEYNGADPYGIATAALATGTITTGNPFSYAEAYLTEFSPYTSCDTKFFNNQSAYCIEPHKGTANGQSVSASDYLGNEELMLALAYGYGGVNQDELLYYAGTSQYRYDFAWLATQEVIWEIVGGYTDLSDLFIGPNHSYDPEVAIPIANVHDYIWDCINQQHTRPSFAVSYPKNTSKDIDLSWNGTEWTATVKDTNYVLPSFDDFEFSLSGVETSQSGYKLTITATPEAAKSMTNGLASQRSKANFIDPDDINAYLLTPTSSGAQECVALNGWPDPVYAYVRARVTQTTGDLVITKTSEDNKISGVSFTITGPNSYSKTTTTNAQGKITLTDLPAGTYTVKENAASYYVAPASQTATVTVGDTKTVTFHNTLKRSTLKVTKTSEDGAVSGHTFKLTGTSASGQSVSMTAKTNASGVATFSNVLVGTNYTVQEVNTAAKYVVPAVQSGKSVTLNTTTKLSFYNKLARGTVQVTKTAEDGLVAGVTFKLTGTSTSGTAVSMTATTNASGVATFSNVLIGTNYTVQEVNTAAKYVVPAVQSGKSVTLNTTTKLSFYNKLARGTVQVTKTAEDGLVAGVTFKLTGTSTSGTAVSMTATTNASGVATFNNVLIGTNYTVQEVNTAAKYVVPAVQSGKSVTLNTTTKLSFYNKLARGSLQITKTSEDGLAAGVTFRLYGTSTSGAAVDETAVTDENGVARFNNILVGSSYTVEEVDTAQRYAAPEVQRNVTISLNTTTRLTFHNALARGSVEVTKTSEDGRVSGIQFRLYGTAINGDTVDLTATTDAQGIAVFENVLIGSDYTLEEVDTAEKYIVPAVQEHIAVTLRTATECTVYNAMKRGRLTVTKTAEDGLVEGIQFRLYGTSVSGDAVDLTATTDERGVAVFENVLIGNDYTLEEINTPERYVIPEVQTGLAVTYGGNTETSMHNVLKKWRVTLTKLDAEMGNAPQGDGTLKGAVYGLYYNGELVQQYTTDAQGSFTTEEYVCNEGYTIREDTAPLGYRLDEMVYPVGAEAADYTLEHNTAPAITSREQVRRGTFSLTKLVSAVPGLVQRFEAGAEFRYWRESAGSYENAPEGERGTLTTNEAGETGSSISLPYGIYAVEQTKAAVGVKTAPGFTVLIGDGEQDADKPLIVYNEPVAAYLHVTKVDAEDGKTIPWGGAKFELYDPEGNRVTQRVTYPDVQEVSLFETNSEGCFVTPLMLPYGEGYRLVEVAAPRGYEVTEAPVYFDVTPESIETDRATGLEYVRVTVSNEATPPTVDTLAAGVSGGSQILPVTGMTITDTVDCSGVIPGKQYTVTGWLVQKSTGEALLDADGELFTDTRTFIAEADFTGQVELRFTLDASGLAGDTVVVFDELYRGDRLVATHGDIDDAEQSVTVVTPEIRTWAKNGRKWPANEKILYNEREALVLDTVTYENLIPGLSYTLDCRLMDAETGEVFLDAAGSAVTGTLTFTPESATGTVDVSCAFNASRAAGKSLVAFETLTHNGEVLATHEDIADEGQTVEVKRRPVQKLEEAPTLPPTGDAGVSRFVLAALCAMEGCAALLRRRRRHG